MGKILDAVRQVIDEAAEAASRGWSPKPSVPSLGWVVDPKAPSRLSTKEEAIAALKVAIWWVGREGRRPTIPLGTTFAQAARINTAPIAAIASMLISPGASKADLVATQDYVMEAIGGKVPVTDSIGFWTSQAMQEKHGYTIPDEGDRYYYVHEPPE